LDEMGGMLLQKNKFFHQNKQPPRTTFLTFMVSPPWLPLPALPFHYGNKCIQIYDGWPLPKHTWVHSTKGCHDSQPSLCQWYFIFLSRIQQQPWIGQDGPKMLLSHIKCKDKLTQINNHLYLPAPKAHHLVLEGRSKMDSPKRRSSIPRYTCRPPSVNISQLQQTHEND
jgi:hypothetical protein